MQLITKSELSRKAGVQKSAITKALATGRLKEYNGTGKIDIDDQLTRNYLQNPPIQRLDSADIIPEQLPVKFSKRTNDELAEAITDAAESRGEREKWAAEKERQQAIKLQMQNAVRRAELFENQNVIHLMLWIDKLHNLFRRMASGFYDEMERKILAAGKSSPENKRLWKDEVESAIHTAKIEMAELMKQLENEQGKQ